MIKLVLLGALLFGYEGDFGFSATSIGQCYAFCGEEQGICMGQCNTPECYHYCAVAYGRCVAQCGY